MVAVLHFPAPGHDGFRVVRAQGELDIATLPRLELDLARAFPSQGQPRVILDLLRVTFADCSTVRVLLRARARALARDGCFGLVCAPSPVGTLLHRLGLEQVLPYHASVAEAVRACPRSGGSPSTATTMAYE